MRGVTSARPATKSAASPTSARVQCASTAAQSGSGAVLIAAGSSSSGHAPASAATPTAFTAPGLSCAYATARIGAILVNINPAYRATELGYVLNQAGITVLCIERFEPGDATFAALSEAWSKALRDGFASLPSTPAGAHTPAS